MSSKAKTIQRMTILVCISFLFSCADRARKGPIDNNMGIIVGKVTLTSNKIYLGRHASIIYFENVRSSDDKELYAVTRMNGYFYLSNVPVNGIYRVVKIRTDGGIIETKGRKVFTFRQGSRSICMALKFKLEISYISASPGKVSGGFATPTGVSEWFIKKYPESPWAPFVRNCSGLKFQ